MAKKFAIAFGVLYLIFVGVFFYFGTHSNFRNIDDSCATRVVDKVEGYTQTIHYENKNELCYFLLWNVLPYVYLIAGIPFLYAAALFVIGCGENGLCVASVYALGVVANTLFYALIGYGIGKFFYKIFRRRE